MDAIAELYDDQKSAIQLTIIGGNGNGLDSLTTYIENLGLLDQVEIIVDTGDAEKILRYKQSDLYFQASFMKDSETR